MYKGKRYNRASLSERTRKLAQGYLPSRENHEAHNELPRQGYSLPPVRRLFYPSKEAESADRLVLSMYLNYLVNAKTDAERQGWWKLAQPLAAELGFHDYKMSIFRKRPLQTEVAA